VSFGKDIAYSGLIIFGVLMLIDWLKALFSKSIFGVGGIVLPLIAFVVSLLGVMIANAVLPIRLMRLFV